MSLERKKLFRRVVRFVINFDVSCAYHEYAFRGGRGDTLVHLNRLRAVTIIIIREKRTARDIRANMRGLRETLIYMLM